MITVKQLIEELSKYDEDAVIIVKDEYYLDSSVSFIADDYFLLYKDGKPFRYPKGGIVCIDGHTKEYSMDFLSEKYFNNEVPDTFVKAVKIF